MAPTIVNLTFDLLAHGSYQAVITELRRVLAEHSNREDVEGRPVLPVQTGENAQPARWIHVKVLRGKSGASPTIAIRDDNIYLVGFSNNAGRWFELGTSNLLPGSTPLGFSGNYQSLLGGSSNLPSLRLDKYQLAQAARLLWFHSQRATGTNDHHLDVDEQEQLMAAMGLRTALACFVVVLCEGARFPPVQDAVNGSWESPETGSINGDDVAYINSWEDISAALIASKMYGERFQWPGKLIQIGINGKEAALRLVYLLLKKLPVAVSAADESADDDHRLGCFQFFKSLWDVVKDKW